MKNIFALIIFIFLLSSCNFPTTNLSLETAIIATESESSASMSEDPRDDGYKTNIDLDSLNNLPNLILFGETMAQIKDDMVPFAFKAYCRNESADFVTDLYIFDAKTNAFVCDFKISGLWDAPGVSAEFYEIEFIDVNFDGYKDIRIFGGYNGIWNKYYIYFIWGSDIGRFIDDPYGLGALGLPTFDEEKQLVHSMVRASAADHWFYTHQYMEGKLVTIEEVSDNCIWENWLDDSAHEQIKALEPSYKEGSTFMHYTKKQLNENTLELVVVEEKYVLFTERVEVTEYAYDSEMGLLLARYERFRD